MITISIDKWIGIFKAVYEKGTLFESYIVLVLNISLLKIHLIGMVPNKIN